MEKQKPAITKVLFAVELREKKYFCFLTYFLTYICNIQWSADIFSFLSFPRQECFSKFYWTRFEEPHYDSQKKHVIQNWELASWILTSTKQISKEYSYKNILANVNINF